jgi:coproporphyrinogen III oxidase
MLARLRQEQDRICSAMEAIDGGRFREDAWDRPGGGGGWARVIQDSTVFEKAGVNVSAVHGTLSEQAFSSMRARGIETDERDFFATGLSLVLHPHNPHAPTVHANYRYFELGEGDHWWFGGGADLTPSVLYEDDARHFHQTLKDVCDRHDEGFYPRFKAWCDDYFNVKHRGERRGLGGIFFDDLNDRDRDEVFAFVSDALAAFVPGYAPILERRHATPFTDKDKEWQAVRRGRYVEFNLVWDRGTHFGLRTNARVESVLMSLPLTARWEYCHEPPAQHEGLMDALRTPRSWTD